ncbi:hypothetical protein OGAPHI_000278 [Ogataea philodendri]|uniref:Alanine--tRNA ligase n=1 Tax=Ogataea philodendri TaxID=1378263 RepID=A0A9P8PHE2_9ASCO|nr:uncharacterized protein OGAPHI_000278 [Ogataea philodendri]KAH3671575.1 hypothetical protein OGAPHI_000278 [Ogataea philodendri]
MSQQWTAPKVRNTFLDYFKDRGHTFVPSSSVIPHDDPTLLFANAGMNQYKPIFLGTVDPSSPFATLKSAVNSQKCIRAGGKHNDLEDVGRDSYHHTFFEMLGNWSFGDYFKKEAIEYSWELLTKVYGLEPSRLYVTYFEGDSKAGLEPDLEAKQYWKDVGVADDHILPGNAKDNFWEMGDQGPCGPCSEVHYDRIGGRNAASLVNQDDPDVLEIWNNVFIQYNREADGSLKPLPAKHVDTGMGFERLVSVLQNVRSNYDTDVFQPLFSKIQEITGVRPYSGKFGKDDIDGIDTAYRVLADHVRTLTFALADGGVPNNEGRGYVLRRILRRGARYVRKYMNYPIGKFFSQLSPTLIEQVKDIFPEIAADTDTIFEILDEEEASFSRTLDRGEKLFEQYALIASKTPEQTLVGRDVWRLYDTYGFPVDLTRLMAEEAGLKIDEEGFEQARLASLEASKGTGSKSGKTLLKLDVHVLGSLDANKDIPTTDDIYKYGTEDIKTKIVGIYDGKELLTTTKDTQEGEQLGILLEKTPFYAEQGGQEYDTGKIVIDGVAEFEVENVQSYAGYVLHTGHIVEGTLSVGDNVIAGYDELRRWPIRNNHTGTHILNLALREILGDGVDQKGSLVAAEKLRFDFSHKAAVSLDQLKKVEEICNKTIKASLPVYSKPVTLDTARSIYGLRAVFGETYPDPVRVVSIGVPVDTLLAEPNEKKWYDYSVEFCGGTHVAKTSDIKEFVIIEESGIAKGIRRIVAVTGTDAHEVQRVAREFDEQLTQIEKMPFGESKEKKLKETSTKLGQLSISVIEKAQLKEKFAKIDKAVKDEIKTRQKADTKKTLDTVKGYFTEHKEAPFLVKHIDISANAKIITETINLIKKENKDKSLFLITGQKADPRVAQGVYISDEHLGKVQATEVANLAASFIGGKAGGKGNVCQGMGTEPEHIDEAISAVEKLLETKLIIDLGDVPYGVDNPLNFVEDSIFERLVERSLEDSGVYGDNSISSSIGFNNSQTYAIAIDSHRASGNMSLEVTIDSRPPSWNGKGVGLTLFYNFDDDLTDLGKSTEIVFKGSNGIISLSDEQVGSHTMMFTRIQSSGCSDCHDGEEWKYSMEITSGTIYFNYTGTALVSLIDTDSDSALFSCSSLWANPGSQFNLSLYSDEEYTDLVSSREINNSTVSGPHNLLLMEDLEQSTSYYAVLTELLQDSGVLLTHQRLNFTIEDIPACKIIYNLDFCTNVAYAVPASAAFANGSQSVSELASSYDNYTAAQYQNFEYAMQQIPCDTELDARYSPIKTCDDCRTSYRNWLCAVSIPRCSTLDAPLYKSYNKSEGRNDFIAKTIQPPFSYYEVLPCVNICQAMVRDCPAEFEFKCPISESFIKLSYSDDKYLSDGEEYVACNSLSLTATSGASLLKVPWILLLGALMVCL